MRRSLVPVVLAVLAIVGTALLIPAPSEARNRDTMSNSTGQYATATGCRGNRFQATENVVIEDFSIFSTGTSGNNLDFYVYENTTETGNYTQLVHNDVDGTIPLGTTGFQSSGPMFAQATAGKYYTLVMCYSGGTAVTVYKDGGVAPMDVSWGSYRMGVSATTGTPAASQSFSNNSYDIYMQTYTSPGGALWGGTPLDPAVLSGSNYVRGNLIDVTDDMMLTSVRQYAQVTTDPYGDYFVPWYIYRCLGQCASGTNYDQVWSSSPGFNGAQSSTFQGWLQVSPNIVLEGGYRYFIGIDHTASGDGINRFAQVSNTEDQVAEWGEMIGHARISPPSNALPPTDPGQVYVQSGRVVQRIAGYRLNEDTRTSGSAVSAGNDFRFGNIFSATSPTRLRDFSLQLDPGYDGVVDVAVYEGASLNGSYAQLWQGVVEVDSSMGVGMLDTPAINVDLDPGALGGTGYYLLVGRLQGSTAVRRSFGQSFPFATSFGQGEAGLVGYGSMDPTISVSSTAGRYHGYEVRTCDTCVDLDGDGQSLNDGTTDGTDDCDDTNAAMYPGFTAVVGGTTVTEICDGFDNNCDGTLPANEADADFDGVRVCAGDCDDTDANTSPQATEICDGNDNDCNSTIPTSELDVDADGFLACTLAVDASGAVLGGDDCNDNNASVSPGLSLETCDGVDQNCDSYNWIAYTAEPGQTTVDGSDVWYGNVYTVSSDATVQGIGAKMHVRNAGTVLYWSVYQSAGGGTNGPWSLVSTVTTTVSGANAGAMLWHDSGIGSGNMAEPLVSGQLYAIGVGWAQDAAATLNGSASFPGATDFGTHIGGVATVSSASASSFSSTFYANSMDQRVYTTSEMDGDSDGALACADCDDAAPSVFPGAPEICDGIDNNCDGSPASTEFDNDLDGYIACAECDDTSASTYPGAPELCDGVDNDCNSSVPTAELDADADGYRGCGGDCIDTNGSVYPGATELCDGLDTNCDTVVPLNEIDNDGDGADECADGDCDDAAPTTFPGASELCDGVDNDCDTIVPSDEADLDADGQRVCAGDCNDSNASTYMGASEICDGQDNDCNGSTPTNEADADNDNARVCAGDCDDGDSLIGPGFAEICDGNDSDCDLVLNSVESDIDSDGYLGCALVAGASPPAGIVGGGDCNDTVANVYPGAPELCDGGTIDNNCNGVASDEGGDGDADGENTCTDCDDSDSSVYTGAPEICDGKDSDCDSVVPGDEIDTDGDAYIACAISSGATLPGFITGGQDCAATDPGTYPGAPELCDAIDNNCDGTLPANEQNPDGDAYMACQGDCDDANSATYPGAPEACDGADNDCNNTVPSNENDTDSDGQRVCAGDCNDSNATIYSGAPELCDGRDNDCDSALGAIETDADGDTWFTCTYVATGGNPGFGGSDCDDTSGTVYPGAAELCDGLDNDCSGTVPVDEQDVDADGISACQGDCADTDPTRTPGAPELCDGIDNNCDGTVPANENDSDGDGVRVCANDCNDNEAASFPGNPEVCDAVDNDCNSTVDEGFDGDSDGFYDGANGGCVAAYTSVDCDDAVATTYPGAAELCDTVDQDCDGQVDETFDGDGDGYFDAAAPGCSAAYPGTADCNDNAGTTYPGAPEVCDGVDQDCDAVVDDGFDVDGDGYFTNANSGCVATYASVDCNDAVATTYPTAAEACNGVNDDCDGLVDEDYDDDLDGFYDGSDSGCIATYPAGDLDCDDTTTDSYPGASEICDGEDNDCDTLIDEDFDVDLDGFLDISCLGGTDCDDSNAQINPLAVETCDGNDQDCDNVVDNGFDADGDSYFDVADAGCLAVWGVNADCDDGDSSINPGAIEVCDGIDQDCDALLDDDFDLDGDAAFDANVPDCVATYGAAAVDCDDAVATTNPLAPETCNLVDDDCDTVVDDGFDLDVDGFYDGGDAGCVATYGSVDCDDAVASVYPGATEACNGVDDDCDGVVPGVETDGDGDTYIECDAASDCDDTDNSQYPGATELCNGEDDDCDTVIDNGFDGDADGYFNGANPFCASTYGTQADCADGDAAINPGAAELCNNQDDDCDADVDEDFDADLDGYFTAADAACVANYLNVDCDDTNALVNPGRSEDCTNSIDDDCDGSTDIGFDVDGDGVDTCNGDCADSDPNINPNVAEVCDEIDNDCDQLIDEGYDTDGDGYVSCGSSTDCDDADAGTNPGASEVCDGIDNDCDTVIDEAFDLDLDGAFAAADAGCAATYGAGFLDCNDANPNIGPAGVEICDGVDNDCSGAADEPFDVDLDGWFDGANANCVSTYGSGTVDCDDSDDVFYPGAAELCDGEDNDCDTLVPLDEVDNDLDGYTECVPTAGHVGSPIGGDDCDDGLATVSPAANEFCNTLDDDCDGIVDEDFDLDSDGAPDGAVPACAAIYAVDDLDCDDTDAGVSPGATELCDGVDQDCDGTVDQDFDLDGDQTYAGTEPDCVTYWTASNQVDCDDLNVNVFPGNVEDCTNGIDDNCNGVIDEDDDDDGDGYTTCTGADCDDTDSAINPGAIETCNAIDDDCDFSVDEPFDGDGDGYVEAAACAAAYDPSSLDCDDTNSAINPGMAEVCNGIDDNCLLGIDETFDLDLDGFFTRFDTGCTDTYGGPNTDCDDTNPLLNPSQSEVCNSLDDDCDGITDEGFDFDGDGLWDASDPDCVTTYGDAATDCDDNDIDVHPGYDDGAGTVILPAPEGCDGIDNDCDGQIPEDADGDGFFDELNAECTAGDDCVDSDPLINPDADELCEDTVDNDCDGLTDLDDEECDPGDDDDSTSDDDDSTSDDDDATSDDDDATGDDDDSADPAAPVVDPDFDGDRPSLIAGCDTCIGSVSAAQPGGRGFGLALLLGLGFALRRRRSLRAGVVSRAAILLFVFGAATVAGALVAPRSAHAQLEQEAERQLDFAWKELEKKDWAKAISSAESALRLNPALYTAMVIKALAYEGMGEMRKAESWLQTYLELTKSLSQAPEALSLAGRLKSKFDNGQKVKAEASVAVGKRSTAFGDGSVSVGGLLGGRGYSQTPCASGEGCADGAETRPGFWATSGSGFGGGLSVRGEYFFGGWLVGARVRYDLGAGEPVGSYGVGVHGAPGHRLDVNVVFRPQLLKGLVSLRILADVGYGMRTWVVYETVSSDAQSATAASFSIAASQLGGGIGVRVEPGQVIGVDFRYGIAGLLGGGGGINDHSLEVGVGARPLEPLLIRVGFDLHAGSLYVQSERGGSTSRAKVTSLRAGLFVGAGVVF